MEAFMSAFSFIIKDVVKGFSVLCVFCFYAGERTFASEEGYSQKLDIIASAYYNYVLDSGQDPASVEDLYSSISASKLDVLDFAKRTELVNAPSVGWSEGVVPTCSSMDCFVWLKSKVSSEQAKNLDRELDDADPYSGNFIAFSQGEIFYRIAVLTAQGESDSQKKRDRIKSVPISIECPIAKNSRFLRDDDCLYRKLNPEVMLCLAIKQGQKDAGTFLGLESLRQVALRGFLYDREFSRKDQFSRNREFQEKYEELVKRLDSVLDVCDSDVSYSISLRYLYYGSYDFENAEVTFVDPLDYYWVQDDVYPGIRVSFPIPNLSFKAKIDAGIAEELSKSGPFIVVYRAKASASEGFSNSGCYTKEGACSFLRGVEEMKKFIISTDYVKTFRAHKDNRPMYIQLNYDYVYLYDLNEERLLWEGGVKSMKK
jgi:hypothetical protein